MARVEPLDVAIALHAVPEADWRDYDAEEAPELAAERALLKRRVAKVFETLTCREERVLRQRYYDDRTFEDIGLDMNLTRERVRQIEAKAIRKIRHPARSKYLGRNGSVQKSKDPIPMWAVYSPGHYEVRKYQDVENQAFDHYSQIAGSPVVLACFANGQWVPVKPEKIIIGEPICEQWGTDAVVAFWHEGVACGEDWRLLRQPVRVSREQEVFIAGHWLQTDKRR